MYLLYYHYLIMYFFSSHIHPWLIITIRPNPNLVELSGVSEAVVLGCGPHGATEPPHGATEPPHPPGLPGPSNVPHPIWVAWPWLCLSAALRRLRGVGGPTGRILPRGKKMYYNYCLWPNYDIDTDYGLWIGCGKITGAVSQCGLIMLIRKHWWCQPLTSNCMYYVVMTTTFFQSYELTAGIARTFCLHSWQSPGPICHLICTLTLLYWKPFLN